MLLDIAFVHEKYDQHDEQMKLEYSHQHEPFSLIVLLL